MKNEMKLEFDAISSNESFARIAVAAFISPLDPTLEEISDVKTAVSEAVTNAIIHGYDREEGEEPTGYVPGHTPGGRRPEQGIHTDDGNPSPEAAHTDDRIPASGKIQREREDKEYGPDQKVYIHCSIEKDVLTMEIMDKGKGIEDIEQAMEPLFTTKPELDRSGMGFAFMEAFMDDLEVSSAPGKGTCVKMTKKIGSSSWLSDED